MNRNSHDDSDRRTFEEDNAIDTSEYSVASSTHPVRPKNPDGLRQSTSLDRDAEQPRQNLLEEKSEGLPETRRGFDWSGSWVWEICGAILSIVCIALMIGFLVYINGMSYAHWQYSISPNTVVSIISAFTKASMLVPVSACLGQLKWTKDDKNLLYHFHVLDQASRGPWGALWVFWNIKSGFAITAAALTIFSIALDPFAQQVLHFPSQERVMYNETAYVLNTHNFVLDQLSGLSGLSGKFQSIDPIMQTALLTGLSGISNPIRPTCSTSHCEFPDFSTLGMCGNCQDVTDQTVQECHPLSLSGFTWKYVLVGGKEEEFKSFSSIPVNCTYLTPGGFQATPEIVDLHRGWPDNYDHAVITFQPLTSVMNNTKRRNETADSIFAFSTFKYVEKLVYAPQNISAVGGSPQISECSLYACEKIYTNNRYSSSGPNLQPSKIVPLIMKPPDNSLDAHGDYPFIENYEFTPKHRAPTFRNSSYYMDTMATSSLDILAGLFTTSYIDRSSRGYGSDEGKRGIQLAPILFNSANISHSVDQMAASMTDSMRSRGNATHVSGKAYRTESIISVRWPWIILPAALVVCSTLLFAAMVKTTKRHSVLWKSSVLPLMMGQLETSPGNDLSHERHLDSIQAISQKIRLVVEDDKDQGLFKFSER